MSTLRYFITEPAEGGYAYWDVRDRISRIMPNFSLITISRYTPNAAELAQELCGRLNAEEKIEDQA